MFVDSPEMDPDIHCRFNGLDIHGDSSCMLSVLGEDSRIDHMINICKTPEFYNSKLHCGLLAKSIALT